MSNMFLNRRDFVKMIGLAMASVAAPRRLVAGARSGQIINTSANVVRYYTYEPFGEVLEEDGTLTSTCCGNNILSFPQKGLLPNSSNALYYNSKRF
jgi:hypothetical protein